MIEIENGINSVQPTFKTGQLFVFEGPDGAGKSTIATEFVRALRLRGISAHAISFPGKKLKSLGELVYRIHHDPESAGVTSITAASLQALHIAAHLDAIESTIIPLLNRGESIVLDRYWWSTWVYGLVDGVKPEILNALINVEKQAWGEWLPHRLFYVTRGEPLRLEPIDKWEKLKTAYLSIVKSEAGRYPVHMIHNETTVEASLAATLLAVRDSK